MATSALQGSLLLCLEHWHSSPAPGTGPEPATWALVLSWSHQAKILPHFSSALMLFPIIYLPQAPMVRKWTQIVCRTQVLSQAALGLCHAGHGVCLSSRRGDWHVWLWPRASALTKTQPGLPSSFKSVTRMPVIPLYTVRVQSNNSRVKDKPGFNPSSTADKPCNLE